MPAEKYLHIDLRKDTAMAAALKEAHEKSGMDSSRHLVLLALRQLIANLPFAPKAANLNG